MRVGKYSQFLDSGKASIPNLLTAPKALNTPPVKIYYVGIATSTARNMINNFPELMNSYL